MKAFLVGLVFLMAVAVLSGIGIFLLPFFIILTFFLRIILGFLLVLLAIWILGKFIIFIWEKIGGSNVPGKD